MTLTPFFKVTVGRRMLKKYPVYTLSPEWMDLTTPAEINHLNMEKYWSDIGDLNLIFKVTGGKEIVDNALSSSYFLDGLID